MKTQSRKRERQVGSVSARTGLAAGDALDACVHRPRACFQLQLTVFDSELARTFLLLLELAEEFARAVLRGDEAQRARGERKEKDQVQAGHGGLETSFSGTRSTALLARGLALTSSALGFAGRPMMRSLGAGSSRALSGKRSGSVGRAAPRMKFFTIRSSREWKLITMSRPEGLSAASACGSASDNSSSS